jgi:ABC-type dipeptide/oligopeptide/nickel transport system permease component
MLSYTARWVPQLPVLLLLVSLIVFSLTHLARGDYADAEARVHSGMSWAWTAPSLFSI